MNNYGDDYFDNPNQRVIDDSTYMFIETLNSVEGNDIYIDDILAKAYITNTININNENKEERTINVLVEQVIKRGSYIKGYDEDTYLVISDVDNHISHKEAKMTKCNQILQWKQNNIIYSYPCVIENDSYGSKTLVNNSYISDISAKSKITVQSNEFTKNITFNWRFCFNNSETDIYKVLDRTTSISNGLITFITEKDKYQLGLDDLTNNIAYNDFNNNIEPIIPPIPIVTAYTITGLDSMKQLIDSAYIIEPLIDCMWEIDEFSISCGIVNIVSQNNNSCVIHANKSMSNESFTLTAKDSIGNLLISKDIITLK